MIVYTMGHLSCAQSQFTLEDLERANQVLCVVYHSLTSLLYNSMTLIPLDRLFCVAAPHVYQAYVRQSTLKKTVFYIWVFSLTWPIPFCFSPDAFHISVIIYYSYAAQGVFLLISVLAYSLIIRSRSRRHCIQIHNKRNVDIVKRTFLVSFSVTFSFVLTYMVPNYVPHLPDAVCETICIAATYCGLAADPLIYILLHTRLRPHAYRLLTCSTLFANEGDNFAVEYSKKVLGRLLPKTESIDETLGKIQMIQKSGNKLSKFNRFKETTV